MTNKCRYRAQKSHSAATSGGRGIVVDRWRHRQYHLRRDSHPFFPVGREKKLDGLRYTREIQARSVRFGLQVWKACRTRNRLGRGSKPRPYVSRPGLAWDQKDWVEPPKPWGALHAVRGSQLFPKRRSHQSFRPSVRSRLVGIRGLSKESACATPYALLKIRVLVHNYLTSKYGIRRSPHLL